MSARQDRLFPATCLQNREETIAEACMEVSGAGVVEEALTIAQAMRQSATLQLWELEAQLQ